MSATRPGRFCISEKWPAVPIEQGAGSGRLGKSKVFCLCGESNLLQTVEPCK